MIDELCWNGFEIDRPEDSTEDPIICKSLCVIHRFIQRHFTYLNFQKILFSKFQLVSDGIFKPVKCALVLCSGGHAVDLYLRICHGAFKY